MDLHLKSSLLTAIEHCNDDAVLSDIAVLLHINEKKILLSDEIKNKIAEAQESFAKGIFFTNSEAIDRLKQWQKK